MPKDAVLNSFTPEPGRHEPLGASQRDGGINFAVFSEQAEAIELCTFDGAGAERRYRLHGPHDGVFHGFLPGAAAGLVYGLRAHGPDRPGSGRSFDATRLLLDPYAREIVSGVEGAERGDAAQAIKARVVEPPGEAPGWANRPRHRDDQVLVYEVQVKGFSLRHPDIPAQLRGTYGALSHPVAIAHFRTLGVTTLSLSPVQQRLDPDQRSGRAAVGTAGLDQFGYFCADPRLAREPANAVAEFRAMVQELHAEGVEVLLDVACGGTPGGDEHGPDFAHPRLIQFLLDSLRFWVREMGVDGFRFEHAALLGRSSQGFDANAPFFVALRQDPTLAGARLLATSGDGSGDGSRPGRFPVRIQECNDRFRDAVCGYWLRAGVDRGEFAQRFTASADLFRQHRKQPYASVNFVAAHAGPALADVVGVEGATGDRLVNALRRRTRRAMMATLLLAQGTPMLRAGDEIGDSQAGNTHAGRPEDSSGCLAWELVDPAFLQFTTEVAALRRAEPLLRHGEWFGDPGRVGPGLTWRLPAGGTPGEPDWHDAAARALGCVIDSGVDLPAEGSARLLLLCNPDPQEVPFALPDGEWQLALDSSGLLHQRQGALPRILAVPAQALVALRAAPASRNARGKK